MPFWFSLALLAAILLNATVLGGDSTSSGALAGAGGERNAPSCGRDAGRKSGGRARNGDKLVVLDSARKTPSETVRKSVSVVKRMNDQSSLSNRNEARNDHVAVGSELHDQPATSHKAQTSADDKHGMKLPHARRPTTSRHSEGGLTSKNPKDSAEVLNRKKEFENMVSGIIAEEASAVQGDYVYPPREYCGYNYESNEGCNYPGSGDRGELGAGVLPGGGSSVNNNSASGSASSSTASTSSSPDNIQSSVKDNTDDDNAQKVVQDKGKKKEKEKEKEKKEKEKEKEKKEKEKEEGERQLEQRSSENSDGRETNNSSEDIENNEAPSTGNSAFLSGSYSSVLLVAVACLCVCAC